MGRRRLGREIELGNRCFHYSTILLRCVSSSSQTYNYILLVSIADPSSSLLIPNHHGLVKINRLPCVNSLVPASDRHSTLRGLATSANAAGGVSENNLAFKVTRKRFVIETFHLDAEGGVGERRTAPSAASVALQESLESSQRHHGIQPSSGKAMATVSVEVEASIPRAGNETEQPRSKASAKKPKKRVGFQVDQPNLYDF